MTDDPDDRDLEKRMKEKLFGKSTTVEVRPSRHQRLTPEEIKDKRRRERERMKFEDRE